jgi:hypothetical protein
LNPYVAKGHYLDGLAKYYMGRLDTAEQAFQFLVENGYSRAYPLALLHLGIIHASRGEIEPALGEFRTYLQTMPEEMIPRWHRDRILQQVQQWVARGLVDKKELADFDVK